MSGITDNLKKVREVLSDPSKYTKGAYSRDSVGDRLPCSNNASEISDIIRSAVLVPEACSFCFVGACYAQWDGLPPIIVFDDAVYDRFGIPVISKSDASHTDCLEMIDFLIQEATEGRLRTK